MRELSPTEKRALADLYRGTAGESWVHSEGWLGEGSPCDWHGIGCEGGRITALDLSANHLTGALPQTLGYLTDLTHLDLSDNRLQGTIPPTLGHLRRLRHLDLSGNRLRGPIPPRLRLLLQLRTLDLHGNRLTGPLPEALGDLVRLEHLDLSDNELAGEVPPALGNLRSLLDLSLDQNRLVGPLPLELTGLTTLESFTFKETELLERSDPAFQAWLRRLAHLESTGLLYAEPVRRGGSVALAALAGAGTLGASLVSALLLLPFVGPIGSIAAAVAGAAGTGLVATKVYELTGASRPAQPLPASSTRPALAGPDRLREELHYIVRSARGELPEDVVIRVEAIERALLQILPRIENLSGGDRDAYVVRQTVREYLPEALDNYRALPREFAITQPLQDGQTAHELLLRQLDTLKRAVESIEQGLPYEDAQRLLIHGRFLEGKFDEPEDLL
ncbi:MAG: leucine-rich repeat domain-containing protein [Anaerolineales bacterium]